MEIKPGNLQESAVCDILEGNTHTGGFWENMATHRVRVKSEPIRSGKSLLLYMQQGLLIGLIDSLTLLNNSDELFSRRMCGSAT